MPFRAKFFKMPLINAQPGENLFFRRNLPAADVF